MVSDLHGADVLIIGDGLIGLSTALELGRAGAKVTVVGTARAGAASIAAAGLLVPSVGRLPAAVRPFFLDSLARYPAFVERLRPHDATLAVIEGLLERSANGDVLHPRDGAVDNVRLLAAVRRAVAATSTIGVVDDLVTDVELGTKEPQALTRGGQRLAGARVILAAGAWAPQIRGLPRPLPVRPLKGQMIALAASPLTQAVMGDDVYLVPRGGETLVGATVEEAGFDTTVTDDAVRSLQEAAVALCAPLAGAPVIRSWSGIRPATPDMFPILGADPDAPALLYACGHSKNGILLAPGTAAALASLVGGQSIGVDLTPFSPNRFGDI